MLMFLAVAGGLVTYLFIACLIVATLKTVGPKFIKDEEPLQWIVGLLFPLVVPYGILIYSLAGTYRFVMKPAVTALVQILQSVVDRMTRPHNKVELPKARVRK